MTWRQSVGRPCERLAKRWLIRLVDRFVTSTNYSLDALPEFGRILVIRCNFRLGNALIAARIVPALRCRYPDARIDFLTGTNVISLFENMGLTQIEGVSRRHAYDWIALLRLIRRLRLARYDAVVGMGKGSITSACLSLAVGATYRIGLASGKAARLYSVQLVTGDSDRIYQRTKEMADCFTLGTEASPYYQVRECESGAAREWLQQNLFDGGAVRPFVALFVGGRRDKRLPAEFWREYVQGLSSPGIPVLLFSGPEERKLVTQLSALSIPNLHVAPVLPIRQVAALCCHARVVVSPDTGTMHLGAALGIPVISLLTRERSIRYAPNTAQDTILLHPQSAQAATLTRHRFKDLAQSTAA